jgi:branched-chain amino acid transport system substrate-binding protein
MTRSNRRKFLKHSAALSAGAVLGFPAIARAQSGPVKVGVLHPVTGFLAYSGNLCRLGAQLAIDEINAAGGIKSLGGARLQAVLGDAQSKPEAGVSEVEKMNEEGVSAIVGAYASAICLATSQAAAKYSIPNVVDVGVADQIVERGLKNTFRFGPGYRAISEAAINDLHVQHPPESR